MIGRGNWDFWKIWQLTGLCLLLAIVFLYYANRVDDLDLWWHLKSGEVILENGSIPNVDNLSYTTVTPKSLLTLDFASVVQREHLPSSFKYWDMSLRHSWLGQVFLFVSQDLGGLYGLGVLKSLIFVFTYLFLFLAMRRSGGCYLVSILVLSLVAYIGIDFNYTRPQLFSFFCCSVFLFIYCDYRNGGRWYYILPLLMFFWQNVHGGFILGMAMTALLVFGETLRRIWLVCFKRASGEGKFWSHRYRMLILLALGSLLLSLFLNPNGFRFLLLPFAIKQSLFGAVEEYSRPMLYEYHAYWFMVFSVCLCILLRINKHDPTELLLVVFFIAASQVGIRAIMFFAIGTAPFLSSSISAILRWIGGRKFFNRFEIQQSSSLSFAKHMIVFGPLLLILFVLVKLVASNQVLQFNIKEHTYPVKAVEFLKKNKYPGRLFNPYNWGGYLIWHLPEYPVFIDGRCLNEHAYFHYSLIARGSMGNREKLEEMYPLWRKLLDQYGVNLIMTHAVNQRGYIIPLVEKLSFDDDWRLDYQDGNTLLFVRKTVQIDKDGFLPKKSSIYQQIISECQQGIKKYPATWGYYETLGLLYLNMRELGKAREMFEVYVSMNPFNARINDNLNFIRKMSGDPPISLPKASDNPHNL